MILSILCLIPILNGIALLAIPGSKTLVVKGFSLTAMLITLGLSLALFKGDYSTGALQLTEHHVLVPQFGISYSVGVDGISLWLILLTTAIIPLATWATWDSIDRLKLYLSALLIMEGVVIGAFVAQDLLLFYVCWELTLIPMFLIVGIWGSDKRIYAALKFFLYTLVGSLMMLVAIIYVAQQYHLGTGQWTFDLQKLRGVDFPTSVQVWLFLAFAAAFAVKVPMFPVHSWLPDAHTQAPTGGSVILAAIMLKLGVYGFLRFAIPLFPDGSAVCAPYLVLLATVGILYGALVAWRQKDVKRLVAYSSISHMGFCMLGIYALNTDGLSGAVLQMVNHGISTGALFLMVGMLYGRAHTRNLEDFGGLAKVMPLFCMLFVIVAMSSIGLPTTNGFVGEFMILVGTFTSEAIHNGAWFALVAATGVILAAVYMLHAVLKVFWGPLVRNKLTDKTNSELQDLTTKEKWVLAPLVLLIFTLGLFPGPVLKTIRPSVDRFAQEVQR